MWITVDAANDRESGATSALAVYPPGVSDLRSELSRRVVIGDGAMGTMLQSYDLTLDDFDQLEGCNEILSVTRPDVVRAIHDAYFEVGVDCVETNTFGTNLSALRHPRPDRRARRGGRAHRPGVG